MRAAWWVGFGFALASANCSIVAKPDVSYSPCPHIKGNRYSDTFNFLPPNAAADGGQDLPTPQESKQREAEFGACGWKRDELGDKALVVLRDGDMVLRPSVGRDFKGPETADLVSRSMPGDFIVVVRVEPASVSSGSRCTFDPLDRAGLVVKNKVGWATLMVAPFFAKPPPDCDEEEEEPHARVTSASYGFGADPSSSPIPAESAGRDAEAFIAFCRIGASLSSYYRPETTEATAKWTLFGVQPVADGPLDVGITTTSAALATDVNTPQAEGHFSFAYFADLNNQVVPDGCTSLIEEFERSQSVETAAAAKD